ncbi:Ig-like domain-containing protein [Anaeromyxobacter oryzae]|uniref:Uncharacterized protein n=1 Tax=Anaeromyxobacter oryzae TaxID=2918170 RepID=A0ABM7WPE7_9BACT|nr:Ig-like domain-containing protein [Anaeromyxobacter oryzae]BDG01339.1 hypothetical protein AMOR_03350 [Anaeromyxobacter oryzae]
MKTTWMKVTETLAVAAALLGATPATAALLDRGPQDPTLVFPQWYRDLNGTALGLCLSQAPSPNPAAGLKPMCFPLAADPNGFAGNLGPEIFYNVLNVNVGKGAAAGGTSTFALRYVAGLEASYLPLGVPVHGTETVFARIRITINSQAPGTYTVTHPFGIEVFPDVGTGPRAVFYTVDIPIGPVLDFDSALGGRLGPFIQWDVVNAGETLTVGTQQFVGDPNYDHTFTGSPFGTNFVRVDGPPGSNLDGAGNDFIVQPLGAVSGQRWTAPIATAFNVQKAVYSRNATLNTVDVWATSAPGQKLVLTGVDLPSLQLKEFPPGNYYGHIEEPAALFPPASVTVTNLSSNPVSSKTIQLVDQLDATATYDSATGALAVSATSSDLSGPTLTVLGSFGGLMTAGATPGTYTFNGLVPLTTEPPTTVKLESNAGGVFSASVDVLAGAPMNVPGLPVAVADVPLVAGSGPTLIDVSTNDTFAGAIQVLVLTQPATGTAVAAASGGNVTYTPNPGASGPDSFTYVIQDAVGLSNVATVSFTVPFVAPPPTANGDSFAMLQGTSRTYAVLANDVAGTGTTIDPASVKIAALPVHGKATPNPDGTITYTPVVGFNSALDTFSYTVANTAGTVSAPATVTVDVFGGPESVSIGKAIYTVSKAKWNIVGSTNWFGPALTQLTATCWTGTAAAPTATTLIGTAPIDTTGKFALVPVGATPTPVNPSSVTCQTSSGGLKSAGVTFQ